MPIYHCLWCDFKKKMRKRFELPKHKDFSGKRCVGSGCSGVEESAFNKDGKAQKG